MPIYRGDGGSGDASTDAYASEVAQNAAKASESAKAASKSAQSAEEARVATEALYDDFDKRYLGPKASEPTTDNKGDPLETGALFFSTANDSMYMYNGAVWLFLGGSGGSSIQLDDLSVTVDAEGVANLEYNDSNGVFTYTPPDLSSYITGNQTITLSGAVTGSGTTSIATTLSTIDGGSY